MKNIKSIPRYSYMFACTSPPLHPPSSLLFPLSSHISCSRSLSCLSDRENLSASSSICECSPFCTHNNLPKNSEIKLSVAFCLYIWGGKTHVWSCSKQRTKKKWPVSAFSLFLSYILDNKEELHPKHIKFIWTLSANLRAIISHLKTTLTRVTLLVV